ncbi:hypothetical protein TNCV_3202001 [Trichonephila clavipes]|nr:hypothetical protein TNCV_3202001 [Trichonephila clavipes]
MSILAGKANSFIAEIAFSADCEDYPFCSEKIVNGERIRSVMSRRKHRSAFDPVSEFDRGRIVAYREIVDYLSGKSVVVLDETKQL